MLEKTDTTSKSYSLKKNVKNTSLIDKFILREGRKIIKIKLFIIRIVFVSNIFYNLKMSKLENSARLFLDHV